LDRFCRIWCSAFSHPPKRQVRLHAKNSSGGDRIEDGTSSLRAAQPGGDLNIAECDPSHLFAVIEESAKLKI
jgi:hypothetical protein